MRKDVLWLLGEGAFNNRVNYARRTFRSEKFNDARVKFYQPSNAVRGTWVIKPKTKKKRYVPEKAGIAMFKHVSQAIDMMKPTVVVIGSIAVGRIFFPDVIDTDKLQKTRGSVLLHASFPNVKFVIIDDPAKCYQRFDSERLNSDIFAWIFRLDIQKITRLADNAEFAARPMDYTLVDSIPKAYEARDWILQNGAIIAYDCETSGGLISCTGIAALSRNGAECRAWTFPSLDRTKPNGVFWADANDEAVMYEILKDILESPIVKVAQNGVYDNQYLLKYWIYPKNFLVDTQILMHSFCGNVPKTLGFIASIFCDNYYYWKDEIKGENKEKGNKGKDRIRVPNTPAGIAQYFEYCAKDCYFTLYSAFRLLPLIFKQPWAVENYMKSFKLAQGPTLQCSLTGMKWHPKRRELMIDSLTKQHNDAYKTFRYITDDEDFNVFSPKDKKEIFYDIIGLIPPKGMAKTTEEKKLRRACMNNRLAYTLQRYLLKVMKPKKLLDDLKARDFKGRFLYSLNPTGTWTGRCNSSGHAYWVGKNAQNVSKKIRPAFIADPNIWFVPIDFSQSDGYFVAMESGDPNYVKNMYRNMNEGYDTHSYHVEALLEIPYDEVIKGKKTYDPKIVDPVTGARQIIKRVVHGTNYEMKENTLLTTTGVESIMVAATQIGWFDAHKWTDKRCQRFAKIMSQKYKNLYPTLDSWKHNLLIEAGRNGNTVRCFGGKGRTHFIIGNVNNDKTGRLLRQVSAFMGQGGTAENINRSMLEVYYNKQYYFKDSVDYLKAKRGEPVEPVYDYLYNAGVTFINQVHDEIIFGVPYGKEYLIDNLLSIMEKKLTIKGREFYVPCEAELGLSWGNLIDYEGYSQTKDTEYYLRKAREKETAYTSDLMMKGLKL